MPSGPGVRWDGGYDEGDTISQYYDNLVGKLVVWAPDRDRAIERMLRALSEFEIEGMQDDHPRAPHAACRPPTSARSRHSTKWVEDEVDQSEFATHVRDTAGLSVPPAEGDAAALVERTVPVEVDGRRFSVKVWLPDAPAACRAAPGGAGRSRPKPAVDRRQRRRGRERHGHRADAGHDRKVLVEVGATVEVGEALLVLEAMKMENHINAETVGHRQGDPRRAPATPSAPATSSPSSNNPASQQWARSRTFAVRDGANSWHRKRHHAPAFCRNWWA